MGLWRIFKAQIIAVGSFFTLLESVEIIHLVVLNWLLRQTAGTKEISSTSLLPWCSSIQLRFPYRDLHLIGQLLIAWEEHSQNRLSRIYKASLCPLSEVAHYYFYYILLVKANFRISTSLKQEKLTILMKRVTVLLQKLWGEVSLEVFGNQF